MKDNININEIEKRINLLKKQIEKYSKYYYEKDEPLVSDEEFDKLVIELKGLEKKFPKFISKDSPTQKVLGKASENFNKKQHSLPMFSLDNAFNNEDMLNFIKRIQKFLNTDEDFLPILIGEPKIDGLSLSVRYENGILVQALTRGDGNIGEDVTSNAFTITDIPKKINTTLKVLEVRGEIFINRKDFLELNNIQMNSGSKVFANPRNAAAGSLRQLNSNITAERPLKYIVWGIGELSNKLSDNLSDMFNILQELGFKINPLNKICNNVRDIFSYYSSLTKKRYKIPYDIDGVVFKVDNLDLQNRLGTVGKDPRWAIAYKFPAQDAVTKIKRVFISVGRTGALTPIAELEPVNIGGVIVSRANLHNEDEVKRKDIREGDTVIVKRAGDVIPQVVEVINKDKRDITSKPFKMPNKCPICGSVALREDNKAVRRCTGRLICRAMLIQSLIHFVSKDAFDIVGLGDKQIELFYELGFIKTPYDIFFLKNYESRILTLEGYGEKSFLNLIKAIDNSKTISIERFIYSLGIPTVGSKTAQIVSKKYINIYNFINCMIQAQSNLKAQAELENIDSIGKVTAKEIISFFSNTANVEVINNILLVVKVNDYIALNVNKDSKFYGKTVVITGTLTNYSRAEIKHVMEKLGATVSNSVSAKTNYLIAGDKAGSKLTQAKTLGIKIITEDELTEYI